MNWREHTKEEDKDVQINVSVKGKFVRTISLDQAVRQYRLDGQDTLLLYGGYAIWIGDSLLTRNEA